MSDASPPASSTPLRVLFVDDEPAILSSLRRSLRGQRGVWDMSFAEGGERGLRELREAKERGENFDVVVSDMRMPGMDGAAVLRQVQEQFPEAIRFVLSGYSEQEMTIKLVNTAHQYLSKPCDAATLIGSLDRALHLRDTLRSPKLQTLVTQLGSLPSPPTLYQKLTNQIADPNATLDDVAATVEEDPAMAGKILQLVNSSFFGYASPVQDLRQAVGLLGLSLLHALVLSVHLFEQAKRPHPATIGLQPHCFRVARLAQSIMQDLDDRPCAVAAAYTGGLLHDLGKLALSLGMPEPYGALFRQHQRDPDTPFDEIEIAELGASHAEVGAYLLGLWNLPQPIVEAVAFHHRPADATPNGQPDVDGVFSVDGVSPLLAVHVADALNRKRGLDVSYLEAIGLTHRLDDWTAWAANPPGAADGMRRSNAA
ncbi:MAG: response regulator [Planctomycetota bacterium]